MESTAELARVVLNRSEFFNAFIMRLVGALHRYFCTLGGRWLEGGVILKGTGWALCAGLDLKEIKVTANGHGVADMQEQQHSIRNVVLETQDLRMNAAFFQFDLSGCDVGVSNFMAWMVGFSLAVELLFTGRFLDAVRTLSFGLVRWALSLEEMRDVAVAFDANKLATTQLAQLVTNEAIGSCVDAGSMEVVVAMEDNDLVLCQQGKDFQGRVATFLRKRRPIYAG